MLSSHHFAVGNMHEWLHDVLSRSYKARFIGHEVEGDRTPWPSAMIVSAAMPCKGVMIVNFAFANGA